MNKVCEHGNNAQFGICPACANAAMHKRQVKADRAAFKARLARIRGEAYSWGPVIRALEK